MRPGRCCFSLGPPVFQNSMPPMSDGWFCKIAGQELGPMPAQELKALAAQGRLHPDDLVRHGRQAAWVPAGRLKGLFSGSSLRAGSEPGRGRVPPAPKETSTRKAPAQPAGAPRQASPMSPPPLDPSRSVSASPHSVSATGEAALAGRQPEKSASLPPPTMTPIPAQESSRPGSGLEFLEQEYSAPAGFKAPRPASSIADVLEQKRQRERRNLTILAGVAVGLMLVLGVLMIILYLKQRAVVPQAGVPGGSPVPVSGAAEGESWSGAAPAAPADSAPAGVKKTKAAPNTPLAPDLNAPETTHPPVPAGSGVPESGGRQPAPGATQAATRRSVSVTAEKTSPGSQEGGIRPAGTRTNKPTHSGLGQTDRAAHEDRAPLAGQLPRSAEPKSTGQQQDKRKVWGDEPPPPTGDPEQDLGISADMAPPGEPTPWSALPDPPPKKSP